MKWLNVSTVAFPIHGVLLWICHMDPVTHEAASQAYKQLRDSDPEEMERWFRLLITQHRPELSDCTLRGIEFSFPRYQWQLIVEHPSLPACEFGAELDRMPLIPNKQRVE